MIELNDFADHFKHMSNSPYPSSFDEDDNIQRDEIINIDILDSPFTLDEIYKSILMLKRNKSADLSNSNVANTFIDWKHFISPYFVSSIFNHIYDNGEYPAAWSKGIVHLHKKGALRLITVG